VIDLHLHTTASDGRSSPEELVRAAARIGLDTIAVADHDTVAGLDRTAAACAHVGVIWVPGIEITAMRDDVDVHMLGYFFDQRTPALLTFLEAQVLDRRRRLEAMTEKLAALGIALDMEQILAGQGGLDARWVGRPLLARALVRAGHVHTTRDAFERFLAEGRPAFVPRRAPGPEEVVALIHEAGGLASLAHPGLLDRDHWIPDMAAAGLDAIEVYYGDHAPEVTERYRQMARRMGLAMTGGSDYHGDPAHGSDLPGTTTLPAEAFEELKERL
jgi:3',5'-nucleoside bisphosphate phosphatase